MTKWSPPSIVARPQSGSIACCLECAKQEVSPIASKDGFTAVQTTSNDPLLYGVPENKCDPPSNGKTQKRWTRVGAAFPHKEGVGFNIELKALPVDGRLVALPPDPNDERSS
jgi:hypothetical protein